MGTFRVIEQNIKDEIINQVRNNGMSVSEAANKYDVTSRTIYGWLKKGVIDNDRNLILENNRLKKEYSGRLDGLVTDIHIYENTYEDAQDVVLRYLDKIDKE
jgi:hypothetical protein